MNRREFLRLGLAGLASSAIALSSCKSLDSMVSGYPIIDYKLYGFATSDIYYYVQDVTEESAKICSVVKEKGQYEYPELRINDLSPDKEYSYKFGDKIIRFRTAPKKNKQFSFNVLTDTHNPWHTNKKILENIVNEDPSFVLHLGDAVNNGDDRDEWFRHIIEMNGIMSRCPVYYTMGNHSHNSEHYFDMMHLPGNERNYSFKWGNLYIAAVDMNNFWDGPSRESQKEWLKKDLEKNNSDFRILMSHVPFLSTLKESRKRQSEKIREIFSDILKKGEIDLILAGHDHYYQRSKIDETDHLVISSAGKHPRTPKLTSPDVLAYYHGFSYAKITVDKNYMMIEGKDQDQNVIDRFMIYKKR